MEVMRLIIAGGGSGGHFFPAMAIINEIIKRKNIKYMYVGSESGIESKKWSLPVSNRKLLAMKGIKNKSVLEKMDAILLLLNAIKESRSIIKEFQPDAVLGVGGYASFPLVMTAVTMGIPSAIHEQNSVPGLANKLLSRFVRRVFISFEQSSRYLPYEKTVLTGLPIRYKPQKRVAGHSGKKTILVLGGSQGAHQINELMVKALDSLIDMKDKVKFIHQTGIADQVYVEQTYKRYEFDARVFDFIDDMNVVFEQADLAISRAGASTLFELAAYGIPAILIPYPSAASDHQTLNANEVLQHGGAIVLPSTVKEPNLLTRAIHELINDEEKVKKMSIAMLKWAKPDSAVKIVDEMIALAGKV